VLLADGARKIEPVTRALLGDVSTEVPLSYCQEYSRRGGHLVCFVDRVIGARLLESRSLLESRGVEIVDRSDVAARVKVQDIAFRRDPVTGRLG